MKFEVSNKAGIVNPWFAGHISLLCEHNPNPQLQWAGHHVCPYIQCVTWTWMCCCATHGLGCAAVCVGGKGKISPFHQVALSSLDTTTHGLLLNIRL